MKDLTDTETNKPAYSVFTPYANLFGGTTTVIKYDESFVPTDISTLPGMKVYAWAPAHIDDKLKAGADGGMHEIAKIRWHFWSGTLLEWNFQVTKMTTLMPANNKTRM